MVQLFISCLLFVILVIRFHKPKNGMFHPKVLSILELCFRTTFYDKITTYAIITGFLTKLAVILCHFIFDFPRQISEGIVHPKVFFEADFEN